MKKVNFAKITRKSSYFVFTLGRNDFVTRRTKILWCPVKQVIKVLYLRKR